MVLRKSDDIAGTWEDIEIELTGEGGWCEKAWADLLLSDQAVYLLLLEGQDLFSESSLALYDRLGFSRGSAQQAITRLINRSLITRKGHGRYELIVPILNEWLKQTGKTSQTLVPPPKAASSA